MHSNRVALSARRYLLGKMRIRATGVVQRLLLLLAQTLSGSETLVRARQVNGASLPHHAIRPCKGVCKTSVSCCSGARRQHDVCGRALPGVVALHERPKPCRVACSRGVPASSPAAVSNHYDERASELRAAGYFVVFVDYLGRRQLYGSALVAATFPTPKSPPTFSSRCVDQGPDARRPDKI